MFKDPYGITMIRPTEQDNLQINWDFDDDEGDVSQHFPVFLFTPDMNKTDTHYHIPLDREQATRLRDWLSAFLAEQ